VPFLDPISIAAVGRLHEIEGTDVVGGALLTFSNGVFATVRCATQMNIGRLVRIEGTRGVLELNEPWFAGFPGSTIKVKNGDTETITRTENPADLYSFYVR